MARHHLINGIKVPFTAQEEAEWDANEAAHAAKKAKEVKTDLSLNNVENTAISTWAGSSNIATVGTVGTGTWQGTPIADAYITLDGKLVLETSDSVQASAGANTTLKVLLSVLETANA